MITQQHALMVTQQEIEIDYELLDFEGENLFGTEEYSVNAEDIGIELDERWPISLMLRWRGLHHDVRVALFRHSKWKVGDDELGVRFINNDGTITVVVITI